MKQVPIMNKYELSTNGSIIYSYQFPMRYVEFIHPMSIVVRWYNLTWMIFLWNWKSNHQCGKNSFVNPNVTRYIQVLVQRPLDMNNQFRSTPSVRNFCFYWKKQFYISKNIGFSIKLHYLYKIEFCTTSTRFEMMTRVDIFHQRLMLVVVAHWVWMKWDEIGYAVYLITHYICLKYFSRIWKEI